MIGTGVLGARANPSDLRETTSLREMAGLPSQPNHRHRRWVRGIGRGLAHGGAIQREWRQIGIFSGEQGRQSGNQLQNILMGRRLAGLTPFRR